MRTAEDKMGTVMWVVAIFLIAIIVFVGMLIGGLVYHALT